MYILIGQKQHYNQTLICCKLLITGIQLLFAYPENHMEIWLVALFLLRKKFHAKQICVLTRLSEIGPRLESSHGWLIFLEKPKLILLYQCKNILSPITAPRLHTSLRFAKHCYYVTCPDVRKKQVHTEIQ